MNPVIKQALAGLIGAGGGVLASRFLQNNNVDVTYEEASPPREIVTSLLPTRAAQILAFGKPTTYLPSTIVYRNHVLEYDCSRRVPRWVAEHLTHDQVSQEVASRKGIQFAPDPNVPQIYSSSNKDYWGSGWSRGHMAPAGNNKHCRDSMQDTFYLTNIVPQDIENNGGYWNRLEIWVRDLTKKYQDVWVISGPLWLPKEKTEENELNVENKGDSALVKPQRLPPKTVTYSVLGQNNVAVPTHLYKVVLVTDPRLDKPQLGTFIVPNSPIGDKHLAEFKVNLEDVERSVGLTFHPELDRSKIDDLCLNSGCNLQDYKQFQQFFWKRRLKSPWNIKGLERDWAEAQRKGAGNSELEVIYNESKKRLEEADKVKQSYGIRSETSFVAPAA